MSMHENSAALKDRSKEYLAGNYGNAVLLYLLFSTTTLIFSQTAGGMALSLNTNLTRMYHLSEASPIPTIVSYSFLLFSAVLCEIFKIGMTLFFLNIACQNQTTFFDLFYGFRTGFGKSFALCGIMTLLRAVCFISSDIAVILYQRGYTFDSGTLALLSVGYIVGMIVYLAVFLNLSQVYYLLLDFPDYSVKQLIKLSIRIMKGHKLKLLYLILSLLPLYALCILSLGIGFFWFEAYRQEIYSLFFLDVMNDKSDSQK